MHMILACFSEEWVSFNTENMFIAVGNLFHKERLQFGNEVKEMGKVIPTHTSKHFSNTTFLSGVSWTKCDLLTH